jgi:nucleotide-binding universal stress UspA family protein
MGHRKKGGLSREQSMKKILCATRGGEASQRTQDAVISMAKEMGASVLFHYVVDVEFLKLTARGVRPDIVSTEMAHMVEFLLAIACERASLQGVEAELCVRQGPLREALESAARDYGADAVAFGQPSGPESSFTMADLRRLADHIEESTGAETFIV